MSFSANNAVNNISRKSIPVASRAVRAAEAKNIVPCHSSKIKTSMPWRGWFSSFLLDLIGTRGYESIRRLFLFRPDDTSFLEQVSPPSRKVIVSKDEKVIAQYRTPSPGSREEIIRQPILFENSKGRDPYDTSYYCRDTARRYENDTNLGLQTLRLGLMEDERIDKVFKNMEEKPSSSPGNNGIFATGKSNYDPTGLRSSMSANHESLKKSLDTYMPDHLPYPTWWNEQDEIVSWYKERNLPVPIGKTGYGTVPINRRISRW